MEIQSFWNAEQSVFALTAAATTITEKAPMRPAINGQTADP